MPLTSRLDKRLPRQLERSPSFWECARARRKPHENLCWMLACCVAQPVSLLWAHGRGGVSRQRVEARTRPRLPLLGKATSPLLHAVPGLLSLGRLASSLLPFVSCAALVHQRAPYDARLYAHVAGRAPTVSARLVRFAATAPTKANSTAIVERSLANFQPRVAEEALSVDNADDERPLSICRQLPFSMAAALRGSTLGRGLTALDGGAKNSLGDCVPPEAAPGERQPPQQDGDLVQVNGCGSLPASLAAVAAQLRNVSTTCDEVAT